MKCMVYDYEYFKKAVYDLTKIDLNAYKEKQMKRRIDTLIAKHRVTGYDNYTVSDMCTPAITTVEVNLTEMARAAVSLLVQRLQNPQKPARSHVIPGRLIVKDSMADVPPGNDVDSVK